MTNYVTQEKRISVVCTDLITEQLADPTALAVSVVANGVLKVSKSWPTDPEVHHDSTGNFHFDTVLDESGQWHAVVRATGAVKAAVEGGFRVAETALPS